MDNITIDLDKLRTDLATAEAKIRDLRAFLAMAERYGAAATPVGQPTPTEHRLAGDLAGMDTKAAVLSVLRATTPRAWKIEDLIREMEPRGWRVENPSATLASALSRLHHSDPRHIIKPRYGHYAWQLDMADHLSTMPNGVVPRAAVGSTQEGGEA